MDTNNEEGNGSGPGGEDCVEVVALDLWSPEQIAVLQELGFEEGDAIFGVSPKEGFLQFNPVFLARLAERIQFDGDVPHLRYGTLPEDGRPAVPVQTLVQDPVLLGVLLEKASQLTKRRLEEAQGQLNAARLAEAQETTTAMEALHGPFVPGASVDGYVPASAPIPVSVDVGALERPEAIRDRQEMAWKVRATTQGRVSVALLLEARLQAVLKCGLGQTKHKIMEVPWSMTMDDEASRVSDKFDMVGTVLGVFISKLRLLEDLATKKVRVLPINEVHLRRVGWVCQVFG